MSLGLLIAVSLLAALALACLMVPLSFQLSAEARAEPDGGWAAAAGVALGPLALSGVGARGMPATLHVYFLGRQKYSRELGAEREEPAQTRTGDGAQASVEKAYPRRRWRSFLRRVDPLEAAAWLLSERGRVRFELDLDLSYSFTDVALTGKMLGGLYMLSPLLPPGVRLRQTPSWDSIDRGTLQATGRLRIFAGLVLCDLIWYMLRARLSRQRVASPS